ncbi:MAG: Hsp20/alpha crystallin family protein [Actinomycetota bacterium]|nr:Hsp20/alpha crystallin family protein [Actinomycetota bacterium]
MLVRSDPFREIDRIFQRALAGTGERGWGMPMDAYRKDGTFLLQFDIPGIVADGVELSVDNHVLTVKATRHAPQMQENVQPVLAERPYGEFTREVLLGDNLDTSQIKAEYDAGVLTVSIPVAEHAKPRRIDVAVREGTEQVSASLQQEAVTT